MLLRKPRSGKLNKKQQYPQHTRWEDLFIHPLCKINEVNFWHSLSVHETQWPYIQWTLSIVQYIHVHVLTLDRNFSDVQCINSKSLSVLGKNNHHFKELQSAVKEWGHLHQGEACQFNHFCQRNVSKWSSWNKNSQITLTGCFSITINCSGQNFGLFWSTSGCIQLLLVTTSAQALLIWPQVKTGSGLITSSHS